MQERQLRFVDRLGLGREIGTLDRLQIHQIVHQREQVAAGGVTLVDDATEPGGLASAPFDGEGSPTRRIPLIGGGRLETFLAAILRARETARGNHVACAGQRCDARFPLADVQIGQRVPQERPQRSGPGGRGSSSNRACAPTTDESRMNVSPCSLNATMRPVLSRTNGIGAPLGFVKVSLATGRSWYFASPIMATNCSPSATMNRVPPSR
mgnify:CR=1 FL=1